MEACRAHILARDRATAPAGGGRAIHLHRPSTPGGAWRGSRHCSISRHVAIGHACRHLEDTLKPDLLLRRERLLRGTERLSRIVGSAALDPCTAAAALALASHRRRGARLSGRNSLGWRRVLRNVGLHAVDRKPVSRERRRPWHRGERDGHEVGQVKFGIVQVVDVAGASSPAESRGICGGETVEGLARARAECKVDVIATERLAPPVAHELERLGHNVAQAILYVRSKRVGYFVAHRGNADRFSDDSDAVAIEQAHR
eukprot:scaffold8361_cov118-Isochrysis_galbana.AAC.9